MKLKALRSMTYATRRLLPGDVFEAKSKRDHRVLLATRKVEAMREPAHVPAPPPAVARKIAAAVMPLNDPNPPPVPPNDPNPPTPPPAHDIVALRAEYVAAVGRNPFMGWDIPTLMEKIAAAKAGAASA